MLRAVTAETSRIGLYATTRSPPQQGRLSNDALQNRVVEALALPVTRLREPFGSTAPSDWVVGVQLMPYDDTPNQGGEQREHLHQAAAKKLLSGVTALTRTDPRDLAEL
jgi:hypothetical protein